MDTPNDKQGLVVDLFRHNKWANLRLLDACLDLGDEHLDANIPGTYGSIRDTLLHIVRAEVSYVHRVTGRLPGEPPERGVFPGVESLKRAAEWCSDELLQMALKASPTDMVEEREGVATARYPLSSLLTQVINHATEHRAQIATILTQRGIEPPDMSGWKYMEEMGQFEETTEAASPEQ